jgi:signal transduction histidine kinase
MILPKRLSISHKLNLMIISSTIITLMMAIITILYFNIQNIKAHAVENINVLGDVIAERSTAALAFMDTLQAEKNLKALQHNKSIELACLYNNDFIVAAEYKNYSDASQPLKCPDEIGEDLSKGRYIKNYLIWGNSIILDNSSIGYIYIMVNDSFVYEEFYVGIIQYTMIITVVIAFGLFVSNGIQKFVSQPIVDLEYTARKIALKKDFSIRAEKSSDDELGDLIDAFNTMLHQTEEYEKTLIIQNEQLESHQERLEMMVQQRTSKLQVLNDELTQTLQRVENMQDQLIESEKMASLGGLVAGIAHEVNTPVGICLTASSFLKERFENIQQLYQNDEMSKHDFEEFLLTVNDSSDMILKNIQRATEIIQNFKKVAVDQSVEDKRCFNIKNYFNDIIKSLHPTLKRLNHTININVDENLCIESYPGSFYQIFSNLILNSVIHGFETIKEGTITIDLTDKDDILVIDYRDDGQGMAPEILRNVFEPFVTTRRNKGGTGLGAHIVYNIVTQQLHGTITCESKKGLGVYFKITMPATYCQVPE